jgi:hypothetical protein
VTIPSGAERLVAKARDDLAQRTGVPADQITVVRVEAVEWRDASLGLPEPGRMYAQVITPGWRIVLLAGHRLAEYHTDHQRVVPAD